MIGIILIIIFELFISSKLQNIKSLGSPDILYIENIKYTNIGIIVTDADIVINNVIYAIEEKRKH